MNKKAGSVKEYIDSLAGAAKKSAMLMRKAIKEAAPDAEEGMSYNVPAYKQNGVLVYFAAYKHHIGFYPTPSAMDAFRKELSAYKLGVGTVQFPLDKPLPLKLITRIVKYRVKENSKKVNADLRKCLKK